MSGSDGEETVQSEEETQMEGILSISNAGKAPGDGWKRQQWALLEDGKLYYGQTKDKSKTTPLNITKAIVTPDHRASNKFLFSCTLSMGQEWWMQCGTAGDRQAWLRAFEANGATVKQIIKEGLLSTRKGLKTVSNYFILYSECIQVFVSETHSEVAGEIQLTPHTVAEVELPSEDKFSLAPNGDEGVKKVVYHAANSQERYLWITAINEAVASKDANLREDSLKEGYLKGGPKKSGHKKLYITLMEDKLVYFKSLANAQENKPAGNVPLPAGAVFHVVTETEFLFAVAPTGDENETWFYFAATSREEMLTWTTALHKLFATKDSTKNPKSLLEGYLCGSNKKDKGYKKRYFVLLEDKLQYFKSRNDPRPEGAMYLPAGATLEVDCFGVNFPPKHLAEVDRIETLALLEYQAGGKKDNSKVPSYTFSVARTGDDGEKFYHVQAKNGGERSKWVDTLVKLMDSKDSRVNAQSLREGYLLVATKRTGAGKKRYCILTPKSISYFKSREDAQAAGCLPLPSGAVCENDYLDKGQLLPLPEKQFRLACSGDVKEKDKLYLTARDNDDKDAWMEVIEELLVSLETKKNPESLLEGYLMGGPQATGHKKMFCVLTKEFFFYYKARADTEAAGEVPLPGGAQCERMEQHLKEIASKADDVPASRPMFVVAPTGDEVEKLFYLTAKHASERSKWVNAINELLAAKNSIRNPKSLREGYLWLQVVGITKKWHKRYGILLEHELQFFKRRNDTTASEVYRLPGGAEVDLVENKDGRGNLFSIALTGDEGEAVQLISGGTNSHRMDWVNSLLELLASKKKQVKPSSLKEGYVMAGWKKTGQKKRYAILLDDALEIFKGRNAPQPETSIPLPGGAVIEANSDGIGFRLAPTGDENEKYFEVSAWKDKTSDQKAWVTTIGKLLAKKDPKKCPASLHEGYLLVGTKRGLCNSKRYVVLTNDHLSYFKSRNDAREAGLVELPDGAEAECEDEQGPLGEQVFYAAKSGDAKAKKVFFQCANDEDKGQWLTAIDELLTTKRKQVNPDSFKEGYLYGSLKKTGASYSKIFAILLLDRLQVFKGRNDAKPTVEILLPGGAHAEDEPDGTCGDRLNVFSVGSTGDEHERYYYLSAKHSTQRSVWLLALERVLSTKDAFVDRSSIREGYLWGSWKASTVGSKYYLILLEQKLMFFKSRNSGKAAGELSLPTGAVVDTIASEKEKQPRLYVASSGDAKAKQFYLSGRQSHVESWLQTLQELMDTKKIKINPKSVREGYLFGCPKENGTEKRLYFILLPDRLQWFKQMKDSQPAGEFLITGGCVVRPHFVEGKEHLFCLASCDDDGATRYFMRAKDHREQMMWIEAFREEIDDKPKFRYASSIKEGYIMKKGWMRSFNKRYFVLSQDGFAYYSSMYDVQPKMKLQIGRQSVLSIENSVDGWLTFAVAQEPGTKKMILGTKEQGNRALWRAAIQGAIDGRPKLFEGELTNAVQRSVYSYVPSIVYTCAEYLMVNGLDVEGLFRVPGDNNDIQSLRKAFEDQDLAPVVLSDVHATAGIFKLYFRLLADPLIPFEHYAAFIAIDDGEVEPNEEKTEKVRQCIAKIPPVNQDVLNYLIFFLSKVASLSQYNKMTAQNCAMVFAPSILRKPKDDESAGAAVDAAAMLQQAKAMVAEMEQSQNILQIMIEAWQELFEAPPDPREEKNSVNEPFSRQRSKTQRMIAERTTANGLKGPSIPGRAPTGVAQAKRGSKATSKGGSRLSTPGASPRVSASSMSTPKQAEQKLSLRPGPSPPPRPSGSSGITARAPVLKKAMSDVGRTKFAGAVAMPGFGQHARARTSMSIDPPPADASPSLARGATEVTPRKKFAGAVAMPGFGGLDLAALKGGLKKKPT